jgi:hypothetical protein
MDQWRGLYAVMERSAGVSISLSHWVLPDQFEESVALIWFRLDD